MEEKDIAEELKLNLLKHLDSLYCNDSDNKCISVWTDNMIIVVDSTPTGNRKTSKIVQVDLNVSFYINEDNSIIATCIK